MIIVYCPYCRGQAELVAGEEIYKGPKFQTTKKFWICRPCDAYIVADEQDRPVGTLANKNTRALRMQAHNMFDRIWKKNHMTRQQAYQWLAIILGLSIDKCHIRYMNEALCITTIASSAALLAAAGDTWFKVERK